MNVNDYEFINNITKDLTSKFEINDFEDNIKEILIYLKQKYGNILNDYTFVFKIVNKYGTYIESYDIDYELDGVSIFVNPVDFEYTIDSYSF